MKDKKDKFIQYGFYLLYAVSTVGIFFGMVYAQPMMIFMCVTMAFIAVIAEGEYFREKTWPVEGSEDYNKIVDHVRHAIHEVRSRKNR
jgi:hypothetical protein